MSVKRNDPCSCGSGRKFKKCCLQTPKGNLSGKDLLGCLNSLCPVLERHARQRFGAGIEVAGWQVFSHWGAAATAHERESYQSIFTLWWLFAWLPDDLGLKGERFLSPAPDHAIAADYLSLHRTGLGSLEQRMIERALTSPYSFHAVLSVESGNKLHLQDIYTQKRVMVEVEAGTPHTVGEVLFCALLSVDGVSVLMGCMPQALGAGNQVQIGKHQKKWCAEIGSEIDQRQLYLHDTELRHFYFLLLDQQQQASLH